MATDNQIVSRDEWKQVVILLTKQYERDYATLWVLNEIARERIPDIMKLFAERRRSPELLALLEAMFGPVRQALQKDNEAEALQFFLNMPPVGPVM